MKFKIGIFGSGINDNGIAVKKAIELGQELGKLKNIIVITGAATGLPYKVAYEAAKKGIEVWGYSPAINLKGQQRFDPTGDHSIYKKLIYVPANYEFVNDDQVCRKYRNVTSTANCDAGIIVSGRWGSMNEFTNLYDMGKVIGVLTGTGGIADELEYLNKKIYKPGKAKVIFNNSPKKLIKELIKLI